MSNCKRDKEIFLVRIMVVNFKITYIDLHESLMLLTFIIIDFYSTIIY